MDDFAANSNGTKIAVYLRRSFIEKKTWVEGK